MNALNKDTKAEADILEYELVMAHVDDSEQMSYTTYGLHVQDGHGNTILDQSDISTSKEYVQGFIDMVKDRDVSPVHVWDILEDYLE